MSVDTGPKFVVANVERREFAKYAGASGDFDPLHYNEVYATESGYDSVFAQGMLTAGWLSHMATDWFETRNICNFSVRFQMPVWPEDTITVEREIVEVTQTYSGPMVKAELIGTNQEDDTVVTGTVTAELPQK